MKNTSTLFGHFPIDNDLGIAIHNASNVMITSSDQIE
jgi:hypothetical protein